MMNLLLTLATIVHIYFGINCGITVCIFYESKLFKIIHTHFVRLRKVRGRFQNGPE